MHDDTALRLNRWLGTDDEFWMNLQMRYDLDVARELRGTAVTPVSAPART